MTLGRALVSVSSFQNFCGVCWNSEGFGFQEDNPCPLCNLALQWGLGQCPTIKHVTVSAVNPECPLVLHAINVISKFPPVSAKQALLADVFKSGQVLLPKKSENI